MKQFMYFVAVLLLFVYLHLFGKCPTKYHHNVLRILFNITNSLPNLRLSTFNRLDNTWNKKLLKYDTECPIISTIAKCYKPMNKSTYHRASQNALHIVKVLFEEERNLFFLGDSVSLGQFKSLLFVLYNVNKKYYHRALMSSKTKFKEGRETEVSNCVQLIDSNYPYKPIICWLSAGKAFPPSILTRYKMMKKYVTTNDIFVINCGLHHNNRAEPRRQLLEMWKEKTKTSPYMIFRETNRQYFNAPNGKYHKAKLKPTWKDDKKCIPLSKKAINNGDPQYGDQAKLAEKYHVPIIYTTRNINDEYLDYVGYARGVLDCSHPCTWGSTYVRWNEDLLLLIKENKKSTLKKTNVEKFLEKQNINRVNTRVP